MSTERRAAPAPKPARDRGYAAAIVVIGMVAFMAAVGLSIDGGSAWAAKADARTVAAEAARYGAAELDLDGLRAGEDVQLDPALAAAAARAWLAEAGHTGTATATTAEVTVTVELDHPTQILGVIGIDTLDVSATATAAPRQDDDTVLGTSPGDQPLTIGERP